MGIPRVLYCTDTYPPQVNGVSVVTALSVAGLMHRGWEVAVVAPRYPVSQRTDGILSRVSDAPLIEVPSVACPPYPDIRLAAPSLDLVTGAVRRYRPDLVHCATEFMIGRLGQIAAGRNGIPRLSSYHTDFSRYTESYGVGWLRPTVSRYIGRFHRRSARVYTPSEPARDDLREFGVTRVEVWGRGVELEAFSPEQRNPSLRSAYGIDDAVVFLHVGRMAAEKGVARILAAFARASDILGPGRIHLMIAGSGPEEGRLRAAAPSNCTFLGVLDRQRTLPEIYASADAFLFSSLTETLGLVVLEAMASGLPVIATPAGGVADHLRDDENGIAVPADDTDGMARAIIEVTMNAALRHRLAIGARQTASALSWEAELDRLDVSYRRVLHREDVSPVPAQPLELAV